MPNRRAEFIEALNGREPEPRDFREHMKLFLRRTMQYQLAGLYYPWNFGYNSDLKYQDLETAFVNSQEVENHG